MKWRMRCVICGSLSIFSVNAARGLQFIPKRCEDIDPTYYPLPRLSAGYGCTANRGELMLEKQYLIKLDERFVAGKTRE